MEHILSEIRRLAVANEGDLPMPKLDQGDVKAWVTTVREMNDHADSLPEPTITLLKYQAANDNTKRAWLRWLWLALIFSVPISFAVAQLPVAFRGTPPSAVVYAVPEFIWGMSVK